MENKNTLEERVAQLEVRNIRVEADKAWIAGQQIQSMLY